MSESKYQYANEYNSKNYHKIALRIPKSKRGILEEIAEAKGKSMNKLIIEAIEKQYGVNLSVEKWSSLEINRLEGEKSALEAKLLKIEKKLEELKQSEQE